MIEIELRMKLVEYARRMIDSGLSYGNSGNISVLSGRDMLITPTGMPAHLLVVDDVVKMDFAGQLAGDQRRPSSEWPMHAAIYQTRPDVRAIVHSHSRHATMLACSGRPIPAFHYMVAVAGGRQIPCAPYARFGSDELAQTAAASLVGMQACLLANHGQIAVGIDLPTAFNLAGEVEELAAMYWGCLAIGEPQLLAQEEMDRVLAAFKHYGQQRPE